MPARGLIVAAAASHSGKTTIALGLIAALRARGMSVAAAKCGPDYIDPRFLEAASGRPVINLDPWAMAPEVLHARLARQSEDADIVLIEGAMGLYDGGSGGAGSTASLAALTGLPVALVIGAQGLAQTAAAIAKGCAALAETFEIAGAIVNHVASDRHAALIREGFACVSVPLLGLIRRDTSIALPSRHLGLVQAEEHDDLARKIEKAGELVAEGCDLDAVLRLARTPTFSQGGKVAAEQPYEGGLSQRSGRRNPSPACAAEAASARQRPVAFGDTLSPRERVGAPLTPLGQRIAVARDTAFAFSYPHLLSDWRNAGAEISFFSPLGDEAPATNADAVFLPGGYPELHAGRIAAARTFRSGMLAAVRRGALVYGECGGYMVLGESLTDADGIDHPMLGLLPLITSFRHRRLALGYRVLRPLGDLPWGTPLAAHEFHFARIVSEGDADRLFESESADGTPLGPIGLRRGRVMGSFAHVIDARD
jgi:cobyrinic acid a,c-diamide synthase